MAAAGADRARRRSDRPPVRGGWPQLRAIASDDGKPDDPRVDISHESLIRQWDRLRQWVDEERRSRDRYRELVARARKRERGEAALLQDPELRTVADWRDQARPSRPWAERYSEADGDFACAVAYLDASVEAQSHTLAEAELARRWRDLEPADPPGRDDLRGAQRGLARPALDRGRRQGASSRGRAC